MLLQNDFIVALPPDRAWTILTDLAKVGPCLPGAAITAVEGDDYHGRAKIKVGPITVEYKGVARFTELDVDQLRAVVYARGKDSKGQGGATATVTATLTPDGPNTRVNVNTDLALTGKVAQFGRGVLADVSAELMSIFAQRLQEMIAADGLARSNGDSGVAPGSERDTEVGTESPPCVGRDDAVLDILALRREMSRGKAQHVDRRLVWVLAVLASLAAGCAYMKARASRD